MQTIDTRYEGGERYPAVNVKVYQGLESLTPEQWEELRSDTEAKPDGTIFGRTYCEGYDDADGQAWSDACTQSFEHAEQDALALFGPNVKLEQVGRSGGWLIVRGLPDVDTWEELDGANGGDPIELPNLKDTIVGGARFKSGEELRDDASLMDRWRFFEEACASYVADVPYLYAWDLAHNVWTREVEEAKQEAKERAERKARIEKVRAGLYGRSDILPDAVEALNEIEKEYVR